MPTQLPLLDSPLPLDPLTTKEPQEINSEEREEPLSPLIDMSFPTVDEMFVDLDSGGTNYYCTAT